MEHRNRTQKDTGHDPVYRYREAGGTSNTRYAGFFQRNVDSVGGRVARWITWGNNGPSRAWLVVAERGSFAVFHGFNSPRVLDYRANPIGSQGVAFYYAGDDGSILISAEPLVDSEGVR